MDELIDILDDEGNSLGKTAMKSEAHQKGWFHKTVHIWFFTSDEKILLQQRGKNKDTHPLLWDVSVAGHIGAGEVIEHSALREIEEEIGLQVSKNDLDKIGVFKSIQKHHTNLTDCEFHHTFISELTADISKLKKQKSEVEALRLISLNEFEKQLLKSDTSNLYVPHSETYYQTIIQAIKERL